MGKPGAKFMDIPSRVIGSIAIWRILALILRLVLFVAGAFFLLSVEQGVVCRARMFSDFAVLGSGQYRKPTRRHPRPHPRLFG